MEIWPAVDLIRETASFFQNVLVVGKGPTSDRLPPIEENTLVVTLNHACKIIRPQIAHFVDWAAFEDCRSYLNNDMLIVMPWRPHIKFKATEKTLLDLITFGDRSLTWTAYNATTSKLPKQEGLPTALLKAFSVTAVFDLLGQAGIHTVTTVGVDGGTTYANAFSEYKPLTNGQKSFDTQTSIINDICKRRKITWFKFNPDVVDQHG